MPMNTLTTQTDILVAIEGHLAATGESVTAFGKRAVGDPNLVIQMRAGDRKILMRTAERIMAAIKDHAA